MSDRPAPTGGASANVLELVAPAEDPDLPLRGQPEKATDFRRVLGAVVLVLMGASAAYSANAGGLRDRYRPPASYLAGRTAAAPSAGDPAVVEGPAARPAHDIRSLPWWQSVTTLRGEGSTTTAAFLVDRHALQWRVKWRCSEGSFSAVASPASGPPPPRPVAQGSCPSEGAGYSVRTGGMAIRVTTPGPWEMTVEQQVEMPRVEPPPDGMDAPDSRVLATASMYDVDRVGKGTVRIVSLPDGRRVLRLEDFFVSINSDLEIWFSEHPRPRTTPEAASAPHRHLVMLEATAGSMNFEVPADLDVTRYGSIVIWCELTRNAYAAASLERR